MGSSSGLVIVPLEFLMTNNPPEELVDGGIYLKSN